MKKFISIVVLVVALVSSLSAQVDRSKRPQPGPAPVIELGEFETFTLRNGLQVIVVENRKIPIVSFQLTLEINPLLEGEAEGFAEMAGELMREGTKTRTKQQIDESVDFIGATLSTSATGVFGSSLSRHKETLLSIMSDVLLNPIFPDEELQNLKLRARSALQAATTDGGAIATNLAMAQIYGQDHPFGEVMTHETLENVTIEKIRAYHQTFFRPNVAYMVIVGDINKREARRLMRRYFARWERGNVPQVSHPIPQPPQGSRVVFAERPGALQSVIIMGHPVELTPGHPDAVKASVMNSVLGGGVFSARLMQNIREEKGWTYGASSSLISNPFVGRFQARTEVRNNVTDSTVVEILYELNRMISQPVDYEKLQLVKNHMSGSFARSLENPRTIANFALNIKRHNLPPDYYATYLQRLSAVTAEDVQAMASKYLKPNNMIIAVAGNKEEVPATLSRFAASGEVEFFDAFGRPLVPAVVGETPEGTTVESVLEKYFNARGGRENLKNIKDLTMKMRTSMMGMELAITSYQKAPNKLRMETAVGGNIMSTQLFDGNKAVVVSPMGRQEFTHGAEFEMIKMEAIINPELNYKELGIRKNLLGIETVGGQKAYKVEVIAPGGSRSTDYYSVETGLKIRTETPMGFAVISDYRQVGNLKFPHLIEQQAGPQMLKLEVVEIIVNSNIGDDKFVLE